MTPARNEQHQPLAPLTVWTDNEVCHGFLGRNGGVSGGVYSSLNFSYSVGDTREAVDANWRRLRDLLPRHSVVALLNQVHGTVVHTIDSVSGVRPKGDGMVTARPGTILGIMTADCVPVLMVDRQAKIAGALHAGWRGMLANIAEVGVQAMSALGTSPDRIEVAMGPAIGSCCFEVDLELAHRFERESPHSAGCIRGGTRSDKALIDLKGILRAQLAAAGVRTDATIGVGPCTRCDAETFFSRRGAGGVTTGLQLSFVGFES